LSATSWPAKAAAITIWRHVHRASPTSTGRVLRDLTPRRPGGQEWGDPTSTPQSDRPELQGLGATA
jgi:hypothetical protein